MLPPKCIHWLKPAVWQILVTPFPKSACQLGVDARVLIPGYTEIVHHKQLHLTVVRDNLKVFASLPFPVRLLEGVLPHSDIPIYVIDCPELYER
ncbi:MAG: hypothetical protein R3E08_08900 [Thiotrichaceae bacterium]